ncbi:MAG TPA: efflux RND transporter permease subunit, partial [Planctomycetaceae bacterium]|nr:efflux RND transporter permease subunit [Planctomycetaceae bacterium]
MQWLAEVCVKRPVFAMMIILALVVAGAVSYPQLGVDRFPSLDLPSMYVRTSYPGAAPEEVESEISQVLEDAIATVAGIEELRSISSEGASIVMVTFSLSRKMDAAVQDVRDAVASVANRLPPGIDPPVVRQQDTDSSPIMSLAVSGPRTGRELYVLSDRFVKNIIESAKGVGQVEISGAEDRAVKINLDARRLAAHKLSILEVREAMARQNAEVPGGRVDAGYRELTLRTMGRVAHTRNFPDLAIKTVNGATVRLSDLGDVVDGTKEARKMARLDGQPAVVLQVQRQSGVNTVETIDAVKQRLARCAELLPPDVTVTVIQDQSRYIKAALHEIQGHLVSGSILATLTVLVFMRSWRSTLIAAIAIPTSIIGTFAFMKAFGFTLNNVTMLALVLMVGVVIDDAIVVLENVFRFIEERGMSPYDAAIEGTREIGLAVLATTLSLVIVFLPVSFLSSVTGRMLYEFGITATVAILISMLVSFTLTPMMCSRLLQPMDSQGQGAASRRGFYRWIEAGYMGSLRFSMKHRWVVLLLSAGVIGSNVYLYKLVKQDYIPTNVDESEFEINLTAKEGASLAAMSDLLQQVETELGEIVGIEHVLATVGSRGLGAVNRGEIYVRMQDIEERAFSFQRLWNAIRAGDVQGAFRGNFSQQEKMAEVRERLKKLPDCRVSVRNLTSLRQGAPVDIDFSITGPNVAELSRFSEQVRLKALDIPGIVDVDTTLRLDKPELRVRIDRERAASLGVNVQEIADTLRIAVGGDDRVSRYRDRTVDDAYDVEIRLVGIDRADVDSISQLYVRAFPARSGGTTPMNGTTTAGSTVLTRLDNLVTFEFGEDASRIDRLDRQRMVAVRANVVAGPEGYALADRIAALQDVTAEIGVPPGFSTRVLGRGKELEKTLSEFVWTFALSFVFMYIVIAAQYEHLVHPITILMSLPLAVPFGLISLYWGGETLNLYSALGILVLFGVVKKASILQIDHTNLLRREGMDRETA